MRFNPLLPPSWEGGPKAPEAKLTARPPQFESYRPDPAFPWKFTTRAQREERKRAGGINYAALKLG